MNTGKKTSGFNILSSRGGKYLTPTVAILVLALTAGALVSGHGIFRADGLSIALPGGTPDGQAGGPFSPLMEHLEAIAHRTVRVGEASEPADLYVHPLDEFLAARPRLGLVPLRALSTSGPARDAAVLFTAGTGPVPVEQLSPSQVVFTHRNDPNGFWIQLDWLRERGFRLPADESGFQFEGSGEHAIRVVYSVLWGRFKIGACRLSDLTYLQVRGLLHPGEVHIIAESAALPELILSARPGDSGHWAELLSDLPAVLAPAGSGPGLFAAPIDEAAIERAGRLAGGLAAGF